ncbi:hypothetical protein Pmar_PMAR013389, partial [Perkinsus marinus ATCC 50983]
MSAPAASATTTAAPVPSQSAALEQQRKQLSAADVLSKATAAAFRGGIAGASAQVVNVFALMWM